MERLEEEIDKLKAKLNKKEKELNKIRISKKKDELYSNYEELMDRNEIELVYQLIFAYVLAKDYNKEYADIYLNKVAELLNDWPKDILENFSDLIELYEDFESLSTEDEVIDLVNKHSLSLKAIDNDDIEELMEILC